MADQMADLGVAPALVVLVDRMVIVAVDRAAQGAVPAVADRATWHTAWIRLTASSTKSCGKLSP